MRPSPRLTLAALVLLAGCSGVALPGNEARAPTERHPGTPVATQHGTETAPPTAADRPNPWGERELVVAIDAAATGDREVGYLVRHAAAFWSKHSEAYAGYFVTFAVEREVEYPDVVVRFVDEVDPCGHVDHPAGCASFVNASSDIDRPEVLRVRTGLSDASTEHVVRHELGHLLGIEHGEPPAAVMSPDTELETLPQPNATQRVFPWPDREFTVSLDLAGAPDPEAGRRQVGHALAYYEHGPEGAPANLTFTKTENRSTADIVVRYGDDDACGDGTPSCFRTRGPDPDGDGVIEEYHQGVVTLAGLDTRAIGWHVGNWLAYAFGDEEPTRRPEPFRDATEAERRSDWWEDDD